MEHPLEPAQFHHRFMVGDGVMQSVSSIIEW